MTKHSRSRVRLRLAAYAAITVAAIFVCLVGPEQAADAAEVTVPSVPIAVRTYQSYGGHISVTWSTPATDGGSPIAGYLVTYRDLTENSRSGSDTTLAISHDWWGAFTPGDRLSFTIAAINAAGTGPASGPTPALTAYTTPGKPSNLTVRPRDHAVYISWTPPSDGYTPIIAYGIYWKDLTNPYGGGDGGYIGSPSGSIFDIDMVNGDTYVFTLDASNAAGNGPMSDPSAPVTPAAPPGAPTGVAVTLKPDGTPIVGWTIPADNGGSPLTGFVVSYTDQTDSAGSGTATVAPTTTTKAVDGLVSGDVYTFAVTAMNATGPGTPSAATHPQRKFGPPTVPPRYVTADAGAGRASVRWLAPLSEPEGGVADSYTVAYTDDTSPVDSIVHTISIGTLDDSAALIVGDDYTVTVAATNSFGSSTAAGSDVVVRPFTVADAPTGLTATAGDSQAVVTWRAPAGDGYSPVLRYELSKIDTSAGAAGTVEVDPGQTSADISGLRNGDRYVFMIRAVNAAGSSRTSAPSSPITPRLALRLLGTNLPASIAIGPMSRTATFLLRLNRPGAVVVALAHGSETETTITLPIGGTTVAGSLGLHITEPSQLGLYTWVIRDAATGTVLATRSVEIKQTSLLGLRTSRSGNSITILGTAKAFHLGDRRLGPWGDKSIAVQRWEGHGWVTIDAAHADLKGHIRVTLRIRQTVGIRLVDAGTDTVVGRQTAPSIV